MSAVCPKDPEAEQRELASRVGCSVSYLYGQALFAQMDLGAVVRQTLLLHGLWLRDSGRRSWASTAILLGFSSGPAWSNFVKRHWALSPSAVEAIPKELLLAQAVRYVFGGRPTPRESAYSTNLKPKRRANARG